MSKEVIEFNQTENGLAVLEEKYAIVADVQTAEGYEDNRKGIAELRTIRTSTDKLRLQLGKDAREYVSTVNGKAKAIITRITALEEPMKAAKKAVDDNAQRIKDEASIAESNRIFVIEGKVAAIQNAVNIPQTLPDIEAAIAKVIQVDVEDGSFMEFKDAARLTQQNTMKLLEQFRTEAQEREKAAQRVAHEAAKLEEERKELEAEKVAADELREKEAAELVKQQVELKKQQDALAAKEKAAADAIEKAKREAEEVEAAKEAEIQAEKDKVEEKAKARRIEESKIALIQENKERYSDDVGVIVEVLIQVNSLRDYIDRLECDTAEGDAALSDIADGLDDIKVDVEASSVMKSQIEKAA